MHDAWQHLQIAPSEFYSLSPRELTILFRAHQQRRYDEYERMSHEAMMFRQAQNAKRIKPTDLFKRPSDSSAETTKVAKVERLKKNTRNANEWLARLTSGGGGSGKE